MPVDYTKTLEKPKEELTTGSTSTGRYQIIEELGKGGMGKVYKAHDSGIGEKYETDENLLLKHYVDISARVSVACRSSAGAV